MKRAANHRKRHVPPGPCGLWFQTQQQLKTGSFGNDNDNNNNSGNGSGGRAASGDNRRSKSSASSQHGDTESNKTTVGMEDMSFSPAWTRMQQDLNIVTPYLPLGGIQLDSKLRYELLRPHVPRQFVLLWEIVQGKYDFAMNDPNRLLVLVHSVESHIHHNIWTVELQDETGVTIKAWMEPKLVQQQLQQPQEGSLIRPGVVWMLQRVGLMIVPHEEEETLERILLISGQQMEQVWTPEQAKQVEVDSPRSQRQFLDWMERRKSLSSTMEVEAEAEAESEQDADDDHNDENELAYIEGIRMSRPQQEEEEEEASNAEEACNENDLVNLLLTNNQRIPSVQSPLLVNRRGHNPQTLSSSRTTQQESQQQHSQHSTVQEKNKYREPVCNEADLRLLTNPRKQQQQEISSSSNHLMASALQLFSAAATTQKSELRNIHSLEDLPLTQTTTSQSHHHQQHRYQQRRNVHAPMSTSQPRQEQEGGTGTGTSTAQTILPSQHTTQTVLAGESQANTRSTYTHSQQLNSIVAGARLPQTKPSQPRGPSASFPPSQISQVQGAEQVARATATTTTPTKTKKRPSKQGGGVDLSAFRCVGEVESSSSPSTQTTKQQSAPKRPKTKGRSDSDASKSIGLALSQQPSTLWSVHDPSLLDMLDDDENEDQEMETLEDPAKDASKPAHESAQVVVEEESRSHQEEDLVETVDTQEVPSLFGTSNFQNLDFSAFSDEDD